MMLLAAVVLVVLVLWFLDTPEDDLFKSKHVALT